MANSTKDISEFKLCRAFFQDGVSIFEAGKGVVHDIMSSQSIDSCGGLISLNVTLATTGPILLRNCYLSCGHACNRCILFEVGWGWKDHPPEQQC